MVRNKLLQSPLARPALIPVRYWAARKYLVPGRKALNRWAFNSREHTNYSYELTPLNTRYLAAFVSLITGTRIAEVEGYLQELAADEDLRRHIEVATANSTYSAIADPTPHYGRRAGWYAIVRAMKPALVIETGVDKGLGSCVLTAALLRNNDEGHAGRYIGTDINPSAGYLLSGRYAEVGEIRYGDSLESLDQLDEPIGLFINDSDHSSDYERREYLAVQEKLASNAVLIGDNAHSNDELLQFSELTGRRYAFFAERPADHWYPGGGIGAAFD